MELQDVLRDINDFRRRANVVALIGDPGTGKTAALTAFAAGSDGPAMVLRAGAGAREPWPLEALVRAILAEQDAGPDDAREALERILAGSPDRDRVIRRLAHVLGLEGGEAAADETAWAFRRLLAAAFSQPVTICVDDVDRIAAGFTTFLAGVARSVRDLPVFVVVTAVSTPEGAEGTVQMRTEVVEEIAAAPEPEAEPVPEDIHETASMEPGPSVEELLGEAARAAEVGDTAGAAALERRAVGALVPGDPRRDELVFLAASHLADAGLRREAEAAIADALAATNGDDAVTWRLRVLRATLRAADGEEIDTARAIADEASTRFTDLGDPWGMARAASLRALVHRARGHAAAEVEDLCAAAEHAAAAGRPAEREVALRGAAAALLEGPLPVPDAIARCEAIQLDGDGTRTTQQDLRSALAVLLARAGRDEEARPIAAAAVATLDELDAREDLALALHRAAIVAWLGGRADEALSALERAAEVTRSDPRAAAIDAMRANLLAASDPDAVEGTIALADEAAERAPATDVATGVGWRTARARALAHDGRHAEADLLARLAVSQAEQTDSIVLRADALLALAEVLDLGARPAEAASFRARAGRLLRRKGARPTIAPPPDPA